MRSYDQYCSFGGTDPGRPELEVEIRSAGETVSMHGVTILGDARDLDWLRQPGWLSGPVVS